VRVTQIKRGTLGGGLDWGAHQGGGTGLGLFLAKGIVEAHGGTLWFESSVGVGSVFYFTVPLCERPRVGDDDLSVDRTSWWRQRRVRRRPARCNLPDPPERVA
jgi:hypothetical protein